MTNDVTITRLRKTLERLQAELDFERWDAVVANNGITLDREQGSRHPRHPTIIYPIDYGYVNNTLGEDGDEVDIFVGSGHTGIVGAIFTLDFRNQDAELKLLKDCTAPEVYLVNGFINFDRNLMEGRLVMRQPMESLWVAEGMGT